MYTPTCEKILSVIALLAVKTDSSIVDILKNINHVPTDEYLLDLLENMLEEVTLEDYISNKRDVETEMKIRGY